MSCRSILLQALYGCLGLALVALPAGAEGEAAPDRAGEAFRRFTHDGAWCWFADPRAIYHAGQHPRTYAGWVNSQGDVVVGAYDHRSKEVQTAILHRQLERDDHASPSLLILPDGRLQAFYAKHFDEVMRTRVTLRPEDISQWTPEQALDLNNPAERKEGFPNAVCYSNPLLLANGRLVLLWRGTNFKPCLAVSPDGGATFERGRMLFEAPGAGADNRPYLKAACRDGRTIHLAFTAGHPRREPRNSVYYCNFDGRTFRGADGRVIGTLEDLPLDPAKCDVVHDGPAEGVRAWVWDVAADAAGRPVVAYTRLPEETRHVYYYGHWTGSRWATHPVVDAGPWFPETRGDRREPEPHYSGGIALDHADPTRVYLARPQLGVFEIERWSLGQDGGWTHRPVTSGSEFDNVRPVAVRNAPDGGPQVLWMSIDRGYTHYTRYGCSIRMDLPAPPRAENPLAPAAVERLMEKVGHWQLDNPARHAPWDWTQGALYAGMMALVRTSDDPRFEQAMLEIGRAVAWKPGPRPFHADDHCVGQMYLEMYLRHEDPAMLKPIQAALAAMAQQPTDESLAWRNNVGDRQWAWCDALFMGPPTLALLYAATEDEAWLKELDRRWWKTTEYLYDEEEHLFFRDSRFFDDRGAGGTKVFWSRGNGWVLAGLARVLQHLPHEHPTRPRYERLFREMCARIASLQQPDGMWRSSLLDRENFPHRETSGTGFYCFALAWGINAGLLEEARYRPVVERAWSALARSVDANGMLEWVQPIGEDPRHVRAAHTDVFGVGAFLLAGEQVKQMVE